MAEPVQKQRYGIELPAVRRFELADIARHAKWLLPRLVRLYPHLTERTALSFLNNVLYNSEFYFCYQPHAVGLVQVERGQMLTPVPLVREKFVWCEDPSNAEHVDQALAFYLEFKAWGERHNANVMVIEEASDVPHDKIRELFGQRIFTREQKFLRLEGK